MNADHPPNILILQSSPHKTANLYACTHICLIFAALHYLTKNSPIRSMSFLKYLSCYLLFDWSFSGTCLQLLLPFSLSLFFNQDLEGFHGPQHRFVHIGRYQLLQYIIISFCFNRTLTSSGCSSIHCLTLLGIDFPLHLMVLHPLLPLLSHGN